MNCLWASYSTLK